MEQIRLTQAARQGIELLLGLPLTTVDSLVAELESALTIELLFEDQVAELISGTASLEGKSTEERSKIADAIVGLQFVRIPDDPGHSLRAIRLARAVRTGSASEQEAAEAKLKRLLSVAALQTSVKATTLITDYDRVYLSSRVLSDVRPVFDDELVDEVRASMVVHTVRITARVGDVNADYYVVADSEDVRDLISKLERALDKADTLKAAIKKGGWGASL